MTLRNNKILTFLLAALLGTAAQAAATQAERISTPPRRPPPRRLSSSMRSHTKDLLKIHADIKHFEKTKNWKVFEVLPSSFQFCF